MTAPAQSSLLDHLHSARKGDLTALPPLLRHVSGAIAARVARKLGLGDRHPEVEDVTAIAISRIALNLPSCRAETTSQYRSWALTITDRVIADAQRRAARVSDHEVPLDAMHQVESATNHSAAPGRDLVLQQVSAVGDGLPTPLYELLWLKIVEELSWKEIGAQLGITPRAAENRFRREGSKVIGEILSRIRAAPQAERKLMREFLQDRRRRVRP